MLGTPANPASGREGKKRKFNEGKCDVAGADQHAHGNVAGRR